MSLADKVPLMRAGATGRNLAIAVLYFVTLPLWILFTPIIAAVLVWRDYSGISTSLSALPGISKGGGVVSGIVAAIMVLVLLGLLGAALPSTDPGDQTTGDTSTDEGAGTTTTTIADGGTATTAGTEPAETTTEQAATPTATSTPTTTTTTVEPAEDEASYSFSGSSNDVTDSFSTAGGLVVFDFQHSGSSNFQVQAVSSSGDKEYLVNEIGGYDGQVALYLPAGEWQLDVTADGSWSADVTQPRFNSQDIKSLPADGDNEHAAWFGPFEFEGNTEVRFEIEDDSQAAVWLATHEGERVALLHNEIGPYEGSALVTDRGVGLIIVQTDSADWRIEIGG